jgi:predicted HTH transcriptional regulator
MGQESKSHDFKLLFDPADEKAKIDLVKNLVAMANAGGGGITFGATKQTFPVSIRWYSKCSIVRA